MFQQNLIRFLGRGDGTTTKRPPLKSKTTISINTDSFTTRLPATEKTYSIPTTLSSTTTTPSSYTTVKIKPILTTSRSTSPPTTLATRAQTVTFANIEDEEKFLQEVVCRFNITYIFHSIRFSSNPPILQKLQSKIWAMCPFILLKFFF